MMSSEAVPKASPRHPLQRFESPSKGFSGALHAVGLISFYHAFNLVDNPNQFNESFGWHLQFLTILGLSISTTCFLLGLSADVLNSPPLFLAKNYVALVAAPIEIVISILYWGLRAIDTGLVVPPDLPLPPLIYDLCFHFFPALFTTLDAILLAPPWPSTPMNPQAPLITLAVSTGIAFLYWFWIEICFSYNGFYPYPIFAILTTYQRIGLFAVSGSIMWVVGGALRALYAWVNGYESVEELEKVKRAKKMGEGGKWE
ncbi:FAR-17a/AIG1-like protein-domain-containing protein [Phaeosphaeria sp. MPI-PUGE-AT-0046c]|nr:FAR-17a/AIG1-like protein-domain-containing protein [Phaeosphaeria sp. MPI-PUGE-AT-0046c]